MNTQPNKSTRERAQRKIEIAIDKLIDVKQDERVINASSKAIGPVHLPSKSELDKQDANTRDVHNETRELRFTFRGDHYRVDETGRINANGIGHFSDTWRFLGGTKHHWSRRITVTLNDAFANPSLLNGCLGFDNDHGTVRQWSGQYFGKLPRITNAYTSPVK